jgi:hypothetical protein
LSGFSMAGGGHGVEGIYVNSEDSVGSRVNVDMVSTGYTDTVSDITLDSATHTQVNVIDSELNSAGNNTVPGIGVNVIGAGALCGTGASCSRMVLTGDLVNAQGAPPGPGSSYNVHNGGQLAIRDVWNEGSGGYAGQIFYSSNDSGNFTLDGSLSGGSAEKYNSANYPMIYFNNFTGNASILNFTALEVGQLGINNTNPNGNILADGLYLCSWNNSYCNTWWADGGTVNSTTSNNVSVQQFQWNGSTDVPISDIGTPSNSFLLSMYAQDRDTANRDWLDTALPAGVTEVYISRIGFDGLTNGIHIKAGS